MKMKGQTKKVLARILTAALIVGAVSFSYKPMTADAAGSKTIDCIGTDIMVNPKTPSSQNDAWKGCYVWYGKDSGSPVRYRVLSKETTAYGGKNVLLESDQGLVKMAYGNGDWKSSLIKSYLNGTNFLKNTAKFTEVERDAIYASSEKEHDVTLGYPYFTTIKSAPLENEKVFLMDVGDVLKPDYGYSTVIGSGNSYNPYPVPNRVKKNTYGSSSDYWQRTDLTYSGNNFAVYTENNGAISGFGIRPSQSGEAWVAPAFNIKKTSILFTTLVAGEAKSYDAEYKLTLQDSDMKIALSSKPTASGSTVTIPYSITGSNKGKASQVSVLILDKAFRKQNTNGAQILYYGKLTPSGSFSASGKGTFKMPAHLNVNDWGTKYIVYIMAEDVNGTKETDYASSPVKITAPLRPAMPITLKYRVNGTGITWNKVDGAVKYRIFRSVGDNKHFEKLTDSKSLSYIDKTAVYGKTYYYKMYAMAGDGSKLTKDGIQSRIRYYAPAPTVKLLNWEEGIDITWTKMSGAVEYKIFVKEGSGDFKRLNTVKGTTYTDKTRKAGKTYTYTVVGVNKDGKEMNEKGKGVSVTRIDKFVQFSSSSTIEGVQLKMKAFDGAAKFRVYRRKTATGSWSKVGTTTENIFVDSSAVPGKEYYYAVLAVSKYDEVLSDYGKGKKVKFTLPPTPVVLESKASGVRAEWSMVSSAFEYGLFRKTKSTEWVQVGKTSAFSYTDKSAESGKTYYYSVIALDKNGKALNAYGDGVQIKYVKPKNAAVGDNEFVEEVLDGIGIIEEEILEDEGIIEEEVIDEETSEEEPSEDIEDAEEETSEEDIEDAEEETSEEDIEDAEEETSEEETSEEETSEEEIEDAGEEDTEAVEETTEEVSEETSEIIEDADVVSEAEEAEVADAPAEEAVEEAAPENAEAVIE